MIRHSIQMRIREKTKKNPSSWYFRAKGKEAERHAEIQAEEERIARKKRQDRLAKGPPKRPPGIQVPSDAKWAAYAARLNNTKTGQQ